MRWPIRRQILLPFALVTLCVVTIVSLSSAYLATRHAERRADIQVRDLGQTLLASSFPLSDAVLKQMHGLSGAHFVLVNDKNQIAAASCTAPPNIIATTPIVNDWRLLRLGSLVRFGDESYFVSALRITEQGPQRQSGALHILYPESRWSTSRREAAMPPLVGGIATLLLSVLLSAAIAGRISRPIARLRSQVMRLARGDFATLALPSRDDELRDLARSVNVLAEQLVEMRQAIRRTERLTLLGQLSGALAHHLRNDITGARMAVQLHQRHCADGDRESLTVALRQLEITEQHLQRLLAAGQPEEPRRTECDLQSIVEHVVCLVGPSCRHRNVQLAVAPARTPPRQHGLFQIEADADQLHHLIMNLVMNAIEATDAGGCVRIEIENSADAAAVRVLDDGPGPPPELAGRLFEEFVTTKAEGVGLGLTVARRIAESHGGTLNFHRQGGFTCFKLTLPRTATAQPSDVRRAKSNPKETAWLTC